MPITQDRMLRLLNACEAVLSWIDRLQTIIDPRQIDTLIMDLNAAQRSADPARITSTINDIQSLVNDIRNIMLNSPLPPQHLRTFIEEKTHFEINRKKNDYSKGRQRMIRGGTLQTTAQKNPRPERQNNANVHLSQENQAEVDSYIRKLQAEIQAEKTPAVATPTAATADLNIDVTPPPMIGPDDNVF